MNYTDLKIGKLVQTVLKPLIINKATINEVMQMQHLEYSKENFGIQYPLLLKTSSTVAEKHYYSELLTLYGETYRLCCEWFETATNNDRPYVEKWIREHEDELLFSGTGSGKSTTNDDWDDFFTEPKKTVEILPNGSAIGDGQYKDRKDLTVIEIPEGVVCVGRDAFAFCSNLKEIIIPESVVYIDEAAFWCCSNLETVKLPEGLRSIGKGSFGNCTRLKTITIPQQIEVIPTLCFSGCTSLEQVTIFGAVRVIMDSAFTGCTSLSSFSLYNHDRLNAIFPYAFAGCKNLVFETIDRNVFIGNYGTSSFDKCSVMIDKSAFDWRNLTIRTFKGTAGAKLAQELGLKVEYVKDYR